MTQGSVPEGPAGRRIVVTGAASGIGRATARLFAAEGAQVAAFDLTATGADGFAITAEVDVTDERAVERAAAAAAAAMGGIDAVVNAAGILRAGPMEEVGADDFRRQVDVNLTGSYIVARACLTWLRQSQGASIVNVASATGLLPNAPDMTAYAASKGGVIALTRAMAAELAPAIRVNCVCPGLVDTPMGAPWMAGVDRYALRRPADPAEIARAILFLTGDGASYVTGATLAADGGRTFH